MSFQSPAYYYMLKIKVEVMKGKAFIFSFLIVCFSFAFVLLSCTPKNDNVRRVGMTPTVDTSYAKGVSGAYCGLLDGHLIFAGGANFPGLPAAEGGGKMYYDAIYATSGKVNASAVQHAGRHAFRWQQVGVLPLPLAYGVSVSDGDGGLVLIGGCNAAGSSDMVFRLRRQGGALRIEQLPSLPVALDNMAGAFLGSRIYVVGGLQDGHASAAMYAYDFNYDEWFVCAPLPTPRVQPVCAAQGGRLYVWGGYVQPIDSLGRVQGESCAVYSDGYAYDPQADAWRPAATPVDEDGHPLTLTGGAVVPWGDDEILAVGGVNRNVFLGGIQGLFPMPDYLLHEPEWYRFNPHVLVYSTFSDQWRTLTDSPLSARAGASLVVLPAADTLSAAVSSALLLGGELKPGIRSTDVTRISF